MGGMKVRAPVRGVMRTVDPGDRKHTLKGLALRQEASTSVCIS